MRSVEIARSEGPSPWTMKVSKNRPVSLCFISILLLGDCKPLVGEYLRCVRRANGTNAPECRLLAKGYLKCRMDQ